MGMSAVGQPALANRHRLLDISYSEALPDLVKPDDAPLAASGSQEAIKPGDLDGVLIREEMINVKRALNSARCRLRGEATSAGKCLPG